MNPYNKPVFKCILITGFYMLLLPFVLHAQANYFISSNGNDNNDGLTKQAAWKSLEKVSSTSFQPGDSILFEAKTIFNGNLIIVSSGSTEQPIIFTSYGNGKAIINAANGDGIKAMNVSNIHVSNLIVQGSGVEKNNGNGIHFYTDDPVSTHQNILIDNCDAIGFHNLGIAAGCGEDEQIKGYANVRIINCSASENGQAGIASYGSQKGFQNRNFYVGHCKAFSNRGIPDKTQNHSGNGIVMGEVDSLLIEFCEAYENGAANHCDAGGPVGIWIWMCRNAVIQHCISHDNHAGLAKDGGGFDIDGGSSNCIIQYNYSFNNEGAGYLLAEYGALFPFANNIVRFNISENDGRKNNYGGIVIWGADRNYKVTNSYVYNNTIYSDDQHVINGTPSAITLLGVHFENVIIANNIFALTGNTNFINADTAIYRSSVFLLHNNYYSYSNSYKFRYGLTVFNSVKEWLANNDQQESVNNEPAYLHVDPLFVPGNKLYQLQKQSSLRKSSFPVFSYIEKQKNMFDNCGNSLPADGIIFPGSCIK